MGQLGSTNKRKKTVKITVKVKRRKRVKRTKKNNATWKQLQTVASHGSKKTTRLPESTPQPPPTPRLPKQQLMQPPPPPPRPRPPPLKSPAIHTAHIVAPWTVVDKPQQWQWPILRSGFVFKLYSWFILGCLASLLRTLCPDLFGELMLTLKRLSCGARFHLVSLILGLSTRVECWMIRFWTLQFSCLNMDRQVFVFPLGSLPRFPVSKSYQDKGTASCVPW